MNQTVPFWRKTPLALAVLLLTACSGFPTCTTSSCGEDQRIAADVQTRLYQVPSLRGFAMGVQCVDHVVYLRGMVATQLDIDRARDVAYATPGVLKVVSNMAVDTNVW